METLRTLTEEARYMLAVLALSIVGLVVGLVVTGDQMDNLARLVFVVGIASSCVMASVVLMGEARDRDIDTLTRSFVARIHALDEVRAERDAYRTALETVTRDAYKGRNRIHSSLQTSEAYDLATYLADYQSDEFPHCARFHGVFVGTEHRYGSWDEYDARAIARAVAKWNALVLEHPTR